MKWHYKAVDYPLEYQFQAYAPGSSKEFPEEVLVMSGIGMSSGR